MDELRRKVRQVLEKTKFPKSDITKVEKMSMETLSRNDIIVVVSADTINATVLMDTTEYTRILENCIRNCSQSKERSNIENRTKIHNVGIPLRSIVSC